MAALTKTATTPNAWTSLPAGGFSNGAAAITTTSLDSAIQITVANVEAVANALGTLVTVTFLTGTGADSHREQYRFRMAAGTANVQDVGTESAADQELVLVAATANFDTVGDWFIIHNTVDVTKSEMRQIQTLVTDTSITVVGDLINTQETSAKLYDLVETKRVPIPLDIREVDISLWNDDADCDVIYQIGQTIVTAIG